MRKTFTQIYVVLCLNFFTFFFCTNMLFSQETQQDSSCTNNELPVQDWDGKVVLFWSFHNSPSPIKPIKPSIFSQLVIWNDGRILVEKEISREEKEFSKEVKFEYYLGKIDSQKIQELLNFIDNKLQFHKHNAKKMIDIGPSASYHALRVNYVDGLRQIITWEQYANATRGSQIVPGLSLSDFYDGWKVIKKSLFDIRDDVMKCSELVDVIWESGYILYSTSKTTIRIDFSADDIAVWDGIDLDGLLEE
ncbi:MAG: hypothetical protein FWD31_02910, partial [Planctomycetaceae bacterium]|nr:hypothetical protein [Planctomycetaceae bacterium]